jgi:hypothetical protein
MLGLLDIPEDVLQYSLAPFLPCLFNLNEAIPRKMRIVRKLDKKWIHNHHNHVIVEKLKSMLNRADEKTGDAKYLTIHKIVKELKKPINFQLFEHKRWKETIINKLIEFHSHDLSQFVPISEKWFYMFKRECQKTMMNILNYN